MNRITGKFVVSNASLNLKQKNETIEDTEVAQKSTPVQQSVPIEPIQPVQPIQQNEEIEETETFDDAIKILGDMRGHPDLKTLERLYKVLSATTLMFAFENPSHSYQDFLEKPSSAIAVNFLDFYFTVDDPTTLLMEDMLEATVICFDSLFEDRPKGHPICAAISNSEAKSIAELRDYLKHYETEDMMYTFLSVPLFGIYYVPKPEVQCILI